MPAAERAAICRGLAVLRPADRVPPSHPTSVRQASQRRRARAYRRSPMEHRDERIIVETERYRITGVLRLPRDGYRSRLTDYLNASERSFLPLTDVEIERSTVSATPSTGRSSRLDRSTSCSRCRPTARASEADGVRGSLTQRGPHPSGPRSYPFRAWPSIPQKISTVSAAARCCAPRRGCSSPTCSTSSRACIPPSRRSCSSRRSSSCSSRAHPGRRLGDARLAPRRLPVLDADRVLAAPARLPLRARARASARGCTGSSTASTTTIRTIRCGS